MLGGNEVDDIRRLIHAEIAEVEREARDPIAGSYGYLCAADGLTFYAHHPVGHVLKRVLR